jgi:diguanylate cyclase
MTSTFWITLGVFLVGGFSFAAGNFLGRITGWSRFTALLSAEEQHPQMLQFAQRLSQMIQEVSQDVGRHQSKIEATKGELNATQSQPAEHLTEFVVGVVGKILESNEVLQKRLHSAESKLQEQNTKLDAYLTKSQTDSLTRLPNRRVFDERLQKLMEPADGLPKTFALIMFDLDHFKAINDGFGHLGGDYVLRQIGFLLLDLAAEGLFAARLGGEEFGVLAVCECAEDACQLAEKVRLAVAEHHFSYEHVALSVTLSAGVAMMLDGENNSQLLGRTDQALYAAKASGRNCCFYHNGKHCLPIKASHPPKEDSDAILELCGELRQRMAEIVKS